MTVRRPLKLQGCAARGSWRGRLLVCFVHISCALGRDYHILRYFDCSAMVTHTHARTSTQKYKYKI